MDTGSVKGDNRFMLNERDTEATHMENFKTSRNGFRFKASLAPAEGSKQKFVVFDITYLKGSVRKGVLATIRPTEIEQCDGYTMESTLLYNQANISIWVKELARKNDKEVVKAAEFLDALAPEIVATYIADAGLGRNALINAIASYAPPNVIRGVESV
jgi:hypothetical protein